MQIVSIADNLYKMSKPVSGKNKKNNFKMLSAEISARVLSINP